MPIELHDLSLCSGWMVEDRCNSRVTLFSLDTSPTACGVLVSETISQYAFTQGASSLHVSSKVNTQVIIVHKVDCQYCKQWIVVRKMPSEISETVVSPLAARCVSLRRGGW